MKAIDDAARQTMPAVPATPGISLDRDELAKYLATTLNIAKYRDYCPNGLQVEGRSRITTIVSGVTASRALIEAALDLKADAVLVHHGYFWRGEDARIIGIKQQRLKLLLQHDLNLFAYHLPLDSHHELGNNVRLARVLSLQPEGRFGEEDIGWYGRMTEPGVATVGQFAELVAARLHRKPLVIGDAAQPLGRIAWCTGGAQGMLGAAIEAGAGVYLSGEVSEPTFHLAQETGTAYLAAGHHATERYGVQALGEHLAQQFGLRHHFVDIDNPV